MAARAYIGGRDPVAPPNGRQAPVAPPTGDRPLSPVGGGDRPPLHFFCQGPRCKFEEKKLQLGPVALWGATGVVLKYFKMDIYF